MTKSTSPPVAVEEARGRPWAHVVLELLWHRQRISRADIARATGLSRSTVSEIVSRLLQTKLVEEVGDGPSSGGRRPILLAFRDEAHTILGVDMGASHVSVALTDLRGRILQWQHRDHPVRSDPEGTRDLILALGETCLAESSSGREALLGVGIAVPSPVDPRSPHRLSPVVMPEWGDVDWLEPILDHFGAPGFVDNDANLGALAERWWGAGRGIDDFAYIKVATGVGAGYIIRGEIYRGSTGVAGEIGHLSIATDGPPCVCGNRGCLATLVGTEALVAAAEGLLADHPDSVLAGEEITMWALEDAVLAGDDLAIQVVDQAARRLGIAVAGVLNLMNPSVVIIGGGLSRLGDRLVGPLREEVQGRTLLSSVAAADIRTSGLGSRSIAVGAATHVLHAALADPRLFPELSE